MLRTDDFAHIAAQLAGAKSFVAVFGRLPPGTADEQRQALRHQFGALAKLVHPDVVADSDKVQAGIVFRQLHLLREAADKAVQNGTYDRPFLKDSPSTNGHGSSGAIIQSTLDTYHLDSVPAWTGDFSALYQARALGRNQSVIVKMSTVPRDNPRLEWEAQILSRIHGPKAKATLTKLGPFIPNLIDTFTVAGEGGKRYRANVTEYKPGMISLTEIKRHFPNGLDPRDAAWIFRRVLGQAIAASMLGVVHGAIVPDHVLVEPLKHEPLHIGWTTAVESGKRITTVITRWRDFYPPEVFRKEPVDHRADLYMAGQTMIYLLGGDTKRRTLPTSLPEPVASIIKSCTAEDPRRRPHDGRVVLNDFTQAIRTAWGRTYRPLILPVH